MPGIGGLRCNFCKLLTYASSIAIRSRKNSAISSLTVFACLIRARRISTTCNGGCGNNASAYCVFCNPKDSKGDGSIASGPSDIMGEDWIFCGYRKSGGPLGNRSAEGGKNRTCVCIYVW